MKNRTRSCSGKCNICSALQTANSRTQMDTWNLSLSPTLQANSRQVKHTNTGTCNPFHCPVHVYKWPVGETTANHKQRLLGNYKKSMEVSCESSHQQVLSTTRISSLSVSNRQKWQKREQEVYFILPSNLKETFHMRTIWSFHFLHRLHHSKWHLFEPANQSLDFFLPNLHLAQVVLYLAHTWDTSLNRHPTQWTRILIRHEEVLARVTIQSVLYCLWCNGLSKHLN